MTTATRNDDDELVAPDGTAIVGTHDVIEACTANLINVMSADLAERTLNYAGDTDVNWDGQSTVLFRGEIVFLDDDGRSWRESQLVAVDSEPTEETVKDVNLIGYNQLLELVHAIHDLVAPDHSLLSEQIKALIDHTSMSV